MVLAEVYGTFVLTFVGTTAIAMTSDPNLFSLGLGFIGFPFGIALAAIICRTIYKRV